MVSPFTGESMTFETLARPCPKAIAVKSVELLAKKLAKETSYDLTCSGANPRVPPLPIDFDDPFDFSIVCGVRTRPVSMCNVFPDDKPLPKKLPPEFDRECPAEFSTGYFRNPHTVRLIKVPNAGRASFRIALEYGKFLFPEIKKNFDLIHPDFMKAAKKVFGVRFAQGCSGA